MNRPDNDYIHTHTSHREFHLKRDFPGYMEYLDGKFPHISNLTQKLWLDLNGYDDYPTCPICGKPVYTFQNFTKGFVRYCSPTCAQADPAVRRKNHRTNVERYGEDYRVKAISKGHQTKLQRYGNAKYNNPEKLKQTMLKRYGVENPMQVKSIKEKSNEACIKKYGAKRKILSQEYLQSRRANLNLWLKDTYPEVIEVKNNGQIFICACTDLTCNKCMEKQFETTHYQFYQRKFKYHIDPCTIKHPTNPNKNTSPELFVQSILDEHSIVYETNNRSILNGKELDIYIPEYKLAIECNGIYWHSSSCPRGIDKSYHHDKWEQCNQQGIQLLTIWEDQIHNKPEIVRNIILSSLGIYDIRIGANKCKLKEVPSNEASKFLNENHLQGNTSGSIRLGLYYKEELVALMVFGRKRTALGNKEHGTYELYRYCCKGGYQIVGGASKIFKHFLKVHSGVIESFSSNDISVGDLYQHLGFHKVSEQPYSYWYIDKDMQRHHRYTYRKDILVRIGADPNLTESQITTQLGLMCIYDSGQMKWQYGRN